MSQFIDSILDKVTLEIYCGHYTTPPEPFYGGADGDECGWSTELTISKGLWEDGFICWCPECSSEITDGYGIEVKKNGK
jgi:hypothetical protein